MSTFAVTSAAQQMEAVNYLLSNLAGQGLQANTSTGEITAPGDPAVIAYLYQYMAVRYADNNTGSLNFSTSPTNRQYYGLRNNNSAGGSSNPADYIWYQVTGGFGTDKFLYYITTGGRQVQFSVDTAPPDTTWLPVTDGVSVNLDIISGASGDQGPRGFIPLAYVSTPTDPTPANTVTLSSWFSALRTNTVPPIGVSPDLGNIYTPIPGDTAQFVLANGSNSISVFKTYDGNAWLDVDGQVIDGNVLISGTVTANALAANDIFTLNLRSTNADLGNLNSNGFWLASNGTARFGGTISIGNNLGVGNGAVIGSNLVVGSDAVIGSRLAVGSGANIGTNLRVGNNANIGSNLIVGNWASIGSNLFVGNNAVIGSNLIVGSWGIIEDNLTIGANLTVGNNAVIGGNLNVTGLVTAGGLNINTVNTAQLMTNSVTSYGAYQAAGPISIIASGSGVGPNTYYYLPVATIVTTQNAQPVYIWSQASFVTTYSIPTPVSQTEFVTWTFGIARRRTVPGPTQPWTNILTFTRQVSIFTGGSSGPYSSSVDPAAITGYVDSLDVTGTWQYGFFARWQTNTIPTALRITNMAIYGITTSTATEIPITLLTLGVKR